VTGVPDAPLGHVREQDLTAGHPTPGMVRREAVSTDGMWSGTVETEPGAASGWHHHGEYETTIYVVEGVLRMEFGAGGGSAFEAGPGEFVYVPKGAIHREANPTGEVSKAVVVRAGSGGEPVVNVDGPA
jgi:uncharacterized RmlC-like cupin family protein